MPHARPAVLALSLGLCAGSASAQDAARAAALDPALRLVRVDLAGGESRTRLLGLGTLVEDYGSYALLAATPAALQRAGDAWQALPTEIQLRGVRRDPLRAAMPDVGGGDYHVVQFLGPARDAWLDELRARGVEFLQYVPHQAFLVRASGAAREALARHPKVRWVGPYSPEYKVHPGLVAGGPGVTEPEPAGEGRSVYDVAVFKPARGTALLDAVRATGARLRREIVLPRNYFDLYRVEARREAVAALAALPGVIAVDPWIRPAAEDERACQIVAGNFASATVLDPPPYDPATQFGVTGQNVTVSVVDDGVGIPGDGGFYVTAANTVNGPLHGAAAGALGHGHLNASIIAGTTPYATLDPLGYNYGRGCAPAAHIVNIPLLLGAYTGSEADTVADTVATAGPNGVPGSISNNSWGAGTNGNVYDSYAAMYDGFVQDASPGPGQTPLTIVFSAGNSGPSALSLTRPKAAKNLIAVANSENVRPDLTASADNMEDLRFTSSRGPTADGRVKPDLTAPGTGIAGGRSGASPLNGNIDTFHRWSTGTSHAAPQVAAAAALFTEFWKGGHGGQNPSPAMVKAALLSGTIDMNGADTGAPRPNGNEGWGRIKLENVLNTGATVGYLDQNAPLTGAGQTFTYTAAVADAGRELRVTLVWTDPPAVGDPALVNDLDLEVTVGATTYRGNVFAGGSSTSGGAFDTLNNVENVFLPAGTPAGTAVTVVVRATALNGDGIPGDADPTDQHFALVAFNTNPPLPVTLQELSIE